jgi:phosphate transport system substrate-binding protein
MRTIRAKVVWCTVAATALLCGSCQSNVRTLQGSGATFPSPLYKRWFLEYYRGHREVQVNYQAIGSGAGIRQFTEELVDFGASDAAMTDDEMKKVKPGVQLLPLTAGSVVICYNVPGIDTPLRLSRETYVRIFLGEITSWDDAAIKDLNQDITLPSLPITVVRRADGSGTTYVFTSHLSAVSEKWKSKVGADKSVKWPVGIGGRGNAGVAALLKQTPGAVGYLEYGFADLTELPMATLQNKSGKYIQPTPESGQKGLANAKIPPNLRIFIPDPEGEEAYPIVTYTWLLCFRTYEDAEKAQTLKEVLRYCLTDGQKLAGELGYIPLPEEVVKLSLEAVDNIKP